MLISGSHYGAPSLPREHLSSPPRSYPDVNTAPRWLNAKAMSPRILRVGCSSMSQYDEWITLLRQCCLEWNQVLMGLSLQVIHPEAVMSGCEINITWQEIPPAEKPKACGWTVRQIGTEPQRLEIKAVSITLIKFPRIDRALSPVQQQQRLAATVLHELGHALGLDHVQSAAAVMHYQGWQNTRLSDVDINALNRLYPG